MKSSVPLFDRVLQRRMRRYWTRKRKAGGISDDLRRDARKLRRILDDIERNTEGSFSARSDAKDGLPASTIWGKRPDPWSSLISPVGSGPLKPGTRLAPDTSLYHDGKTGEVFAKQVLEEHTGYPELSLDVAEFDGDYVSLALALPQTEIAAIQRNDLIRLDLTHTSSRPINATARANVKIGPNVEVITREIDRHRARPFVEFDLFYAELDAQKITDVWVDVIFDKPTTNVITIHDLRLSRRPRAGA